MGNDGGSPSTAEQLSVVPEEVSALGCYIYDAAQSLQSALQSAGREVEALTSGTWSGPASVTFSRGWQECSSGGAEIIDALTEMAEKLGVTADNYIHSDTRRASDISSLDLP